MSNNFKLVKLCSKENYRDNLYNINFNDKNIDEFLEKHFEVLINKIYKFLSDELTGIHFVEFLTLYCYDIFENPTFQDKVLKFIYKYPNLPWSYNVIHKLKLCFKLEYNDEFDHFFKNNLDKNWNFDILFENFFTGSTLLNIPENIPLFEKYFSFEYLKNEFDKYNEARKDKNFSEIEGYKYQSFLQSIIYKLDYLSKFENKPFSPSEFLKYPGFYVPSEISKKLKELE